MKIRQTAQHLAARAALEMPLVGPKVRQKLVDLHTRVFSERAPEDRRDERKEHLDAFFDATMDMYLQGLKEGMTEAQARELVHIVANVEFARLGWTEMMEFPVDEVEANVARYQAFFDAHRVTPEDALGAFRPPEGIPEAPATPEKLDAPESPHAEVGYADDTYVETGDGDLVRGPQGIEGERQA